MLKKLLYASALISSTYGGHQLACGEDQYVDPIFSIAGFNTQPNNDFDIYSNELSISSDAIRSEEWQIYRITSNPIHAVIESNNPDMLIQLKTQWIQEIIHILLDLRPAFSHIVNTTLAADSLRTMFWNRIHLLKAWHESVISILRKDSLFNEQDNNVLSLQTQLQNILSFCSKVDKSDSKPFMFITPSIASVFNYNGRSYSGFQLLQSFFNIFDSGDTMDVFPDQVPAVSVERTELVFDSDPASDLFQTALTKESIEKYLDFEHMNLNEEPLFNSEFRSHLLTLTQECNELISWLSEPSLGNTVYSIELIQQLFWNRIFLVRLIIEKALMSPAGFTDTTLKTLRYIYPRLVFFIDKITRESSDYFQRVTPQTKHRVYNGDLYSGRKNFTPGERLQILFNGLWG